MTDIHTHVSHWRNGAHEDMRVARELVDLGRIRHGLFFAYSSLEKILKAHICEYTRAIAPRLNNLVRLAGLTRLQIADLHLDLLEDLNAFGAEGWYPESLAQLPSLAEAQMYIVRAEEALEWFTQQLLASAGAV
jgi:HEPN domain-containing protein